ncbi:MAG: universal stress protein, partial [Chloroflexota bacterium]
NSDDSAHSITSPLLVQRFAPGLQAAGEEEQPAELFSNILVPVTDAKAQEHLLALASLLTRAGSGRVMVVSVAKSAGATESSFVFHREQLSRVPEIMGDPSTDVELIPRLAASHAEGILHTALERRASLILMGWRGRRTLQQSVLGTVLDEVIWGSDTPVMVGKLNYPLNGIQRVLLILPPKALAPQVMRRILEANLALAKALNVPLTIHTDLEYAQQMEALLARRETGQPVEIEAAKGPLNVHKLEKDNLSDLIVVPGFGPRQRFLSGVGYLPERLAASFSGNLIILHFDK